MNNYLFLLYTIAAGIQVIVVFCILMGLIIKTYCPRSRGCCYDCDEDEEYVEKRRKKAGDTGPATAAVPIAPPVAGSLRTDESRVFIKERRPNSAVAFLPLKNAPGTITFGKGKV
jgi:hypothetical protein